MHPSAMGFFADGLPFPPFLDLARSAPISLGPLHCGAPPRGTLFVFLANVPFPTPLTRKLDPPLQEYQPIRLACGTSETTTGCPCPPLPTPYP